MNTIFAYVTGKDRICWGFWIEEKTSFTIDTCNYYLNKANRLYKILFKVDPQFTYIKLEYDEYKLTYDKKSNKILVYKNDEPIYLNDNGYICKDTVAIMDTI